MATLYEVFQSIGLTYYFVKSKDGMLFVQASTHRDMFDNPITAVWHKVATSIAFRVNFKEKNIHIQRINSKQKGMGTKMVDAVVNHFPGYGYSVMDQSRRMGDVGPTFWDKMKIKYPIQVAKPPKSTPPNINHIMLTLKLASITRR